MLSTNCIKIGALPMLAGLPAAFAKLRDDDVVQVLFVFNFYLFYKLFYKINYYIILNINI